MTFRGVLSCPVTRTRRAVTDGVLARFVKGSRRS